MKEKWEKLRSNKKCVAFCWVVVILVPTVYISTNVIVMGLNYIFLTLFNIDLKIRQPGVLPTIVVFLMYTWHIFFKNKEDK